MDLLAGPPTDMRSLSLQLQAQNPALSSIDFEFDEVIGPVGDLGLTALAASLPENRVVTELNLANNDVGAQGAAKLGVALERNASITCLSLRDNPQLGDAGAEPLLAALAGPEQVRSRDAADNNRTVRTLHLANAGLCSRAGWVLRHVLCANDALVTLDLGGNRLCAAGVRDLAHGLQENAKAGAPLATLVLTDNQAGDEGAAALGTALSKHHALTALHLADNEIGDDGVKALVAGLRGTKHLRALQLRGNNITDAGATELGRLLASHHHLALLSLGANEVGEHGAKQIAAGMRESKSLRVLELDGNSLCDPGGRYIAIACEHCRLEVLDMSDAELSDACCPQLQHALWRSPTLRELRISCNDIGDNGTEVLYWGLLQNRACTMLEMRGNPCHFHPTAAHPWLLSAIEQLLSYPLASRPELRAASREMLRERGAAAITLGAMARGGVTRRHARRGRRMWRLHTRHALRVQAVVRGRGGRNAARARREMLASEAAAEKEARIAREESQRADEQAAAAAAAAAVAAAEAKAAFHERQRRAAVAVQALARGVMARSRIAKMALEQAGQTVGALVAVAGLTTEGEDGWYVDSTSNKVAHFSFPAESDAAGRRASVGQGGERTQNTSPPLPQAALEAALAAARAPEAMGLPVAFVPQRETMVPRRALLFLGARGELVRLQPDEARALSRRRMMLALGGCEREGFERSASAAAGMQAEEQAAAAAGGALLPSPFASSPPWCALQLQLAGLTVAATAELRAQQEAGTGQPPELELRLSTVASDASFVEIWRSEMMQWAPDAPAIAFPLGMVSRLSLFGAPAAHTEEQDEEAEDETKAQDEGLLWQRPLALECVSTPAIDLHSAPAEDDVGGPRLIGRCYITAASLVAAAAASSEGGALPPLCAAVPDGDAVSYTDAGTLTVLQFRSSVFGDDTASSARGSGDTTASYEQYIDRVETWWQQEQRTRVQAMARASQWSRLAQQCGGLSREEYALRCAGSGTADVAPVFARIAFSGTLSGFKGVTPTTRARLCRLRNDDPAAAKFAAGAADNEWKQVWGCPAVEKSLAPTWECSEVLISAVCGAHEPTAASAAAFAGEAAGGDLCAPLQLEVYDGDTLLGTLHTSLSDLMQARGREFPLVMRSATAQCSIKIVKCELNPGMDVNRESLAEGYENYIVKLRQWWLLENANVSADSDSAWIRDSWLEVDYA